MTTGLYGGLASQGVQGSLADLHEDAVQLAGRLVAISNETAVISEQQVRNIEKALVSVAQSNLPQARLVCGTLGIHAFPKVNLHDINIYVEEHVRWAHELMRGDKPSNSILAGIMEENGLTAALLSNHNGLMAFRLYSSEPINARYVANLLSLAKDVLLAEVPVTDGDGSDISIKQVQGGWMVTYNLRYNNCSIFCKNEHSWQFGVRESGDVVFMGEFGDELPEEYKVSAAAVSSGESAGN